MRIAGCLAAVLAAACQDAETGRGAGEGAERLAGRWTLELRLERPAQLGTQVTAVEPVAGEVLLLARGAATPGQGTHYGAHAVNTHAFGIQLAPHGAVPTVIATLRGDSVEMTLNPNGSGLQLSGGLAGDSLAGRWSWHGPGRPSPSAGGRFLMHRHR